MVTSEAQNTKALHQKHGRRRNLSPYQGMLGRQYKQDASVETLLFDFLNLEVVLTFTHTNHCGLIYMLYHPLSHSSESPEPIFLRDNKKHFENCNHSELVAVIFFYPKSTHFVLDRGGVHIKSSQSGA